MLGSTHVRATAALRAACCACSRPSTQWLLLQTSVPLAHMMTVLCLVEMTRRIAFLCREWCSSATASAHHYFKFCFCTQ